MNTTVNKNNLIRKRHTRKRVHAVRRIRIAFTALCLLSCIFVAKSGVVSVQAATISPKTTTCNYYTGIKLEDGQTLESVADTYNNYDNMDNDEYIAQIMKINNLVETRVHPGCYITVMYTK